GASTPIDFPEAVYSAFSAVNAEFDAPAFRYVYTSLVTPPSVYRREVKSGSTSLLKREPVLNGYRPEEYVDERLWVAAPDGVKVPVSLVYKKGRRLDGKGALLLEGYGAYGISNDVGFDSARVSLLERGVAFAIAHVRGGGDLGKKWHDGG